mmetsp:Transcript_53105/g.106646  ORF Transcript_53105/g.106646 Transcript_53105/m.106646 type:complete len:323 (+) Transcript_53105:525-1493(+)
MRSAIEVQAPCGIDELSRVMARATGGIPWDEEAPRARRCAEARGSEAPKSGCESDSTLASPRDAETHWSPPAPKAGFFAEHQSEARTAARARQRPWPLPCATRAGRAPEHWRDGALGDVEDAAGGLLRVAAKRLVRQCLLDATGWQERGRLAVACRSACCVVAGSCDPDTEPSRRRRLQTAYKDFRGKVLCHACRDDGEFGRDSAISLLDRMRGGATFRGELSVTCRKGLVTWSEDGLDRWALLYDRESEGVVLRFSGCKAGAAADDVWTQDESFVSFWAGASDVGLAAYCMSAWYSGRPEVLHAEGFPPVGVRCQDLAAKP